MTDFKLEQAIDEDTVREYLRALARDAGNELAAARRENKRLLNEVAALEEKVKELEDDNLELAKAINGLEEDYAIARRRYWGTR